MKLMIIVFLGADNSVKLGDFGLSKIMASHDFASTYVGTPFYMSPEICAAERYTLHSDIWSLGCIMYELCARVPPFNAKTHFHLIQKIKEGRVDPLPSIYSPELQNVIKSCLKTNPLNRPDTATLLNLPVVRLMRKEKEVVALGKHLKSKEEQALQRAYEAETMVSRLEAEKEKMKAEIESTVRREWEVKARLEIDRQIQCEMEKLHKKFETEVQARVEVEVQAHLRSLKAQDHPLVPTTDEIPLSSVNTSNDSDFPSTTDLSSLSIDSPLSSRSHRALPKKPARTPFSRARTTYDSPMDVQMAEPSPMSIASLSLSPRRTAAAASSALPGSQNIFTAAGAAQKAKWDPHLASASPSDENGDDADETQQEEEDDEDEDSLPDLPSPTRAPSRAPAHDPFKAPPPPRPSLLRQKTAPPALPPPPPALFPPPAVPRLNPLGTQPPAATGPTNPPVAPPPFKPFAAVPSTTAPAPPPTSPHRRRSLLPPSNPALPAPDAGAGAVSPLRKGPRTPPRALKAARAGVGGEDMFKAVMQRNLLGGGGGRWGCWGRPERGGWGAGGGAGGGGERVWGWLGGGVVGGGGRTLVELAQARAGGVGSGSGAGKGGEEGGVRMAEREGEVVWDPERDEMPSPFLVRGGRGMRRL